MAPTEMQLRQAFRELRKHDWPAAFDELPSDGLKYRLVRLRAALIARGLRFDTTPVRRPSAITPEPPPHGTPQRAWRGNEGYQTKAAPLALDRKRLAAGERDDD